MKKTTMNRLRIWLLFYTLALVASFAGVGVLSLFLPVGVWYWTAIGLWLLGCFASLCFPDDIWDRWISKEL